MNARTLSERVDAWLVRDPHLTFYERIEALARSEALFASLPPAERYGRTLGFILDEIGVPLRPGELLAGAVNEIVPSPEQVEFVERHSAAWWDRPPEDIRRDCAFWYSHNWLRRRPPWFTSFGHLGFAWDDLLALGLDGLARRAAATRERLGADATPDQRSFLDGAALCYEAISRYILRYAEAAEAAAAASGNHGDAAADPEMAACLRAVARGPAGSFREALQLLWLVTLVVQKVCGCGVLDYGRMDQYLLPFYGRDAAAGRLSRQAALDLLREFFFKNNEIMTPVDHMSLDSEGTQFTLEVTFDDPNYLIVGGLLPDGASGVNDLSRLMVEATSSLRLRNPFMVVRHHPGIDEDFMLAVCAAVRDNASLVIYNDDTMIPALRENGVAAADAANYGLFGCNDPDIPGEAGGLRQLWWNLARPLELALNRGDCFMQPRAAGEAGVSGFSALDRATGLMTGPYYGEATPDPDSVTDMDGFLELYRRQTLALLSAYRAGFEADLAEERERFAGQLRIEDCFLRGPVEEAVTWTLGGTRYHFIVTQGTGLATVADSLYALDEVVFRNREMTPGQFAAVLARDWRGHEELRDRLWRRAAKFGNDLPEVDRYAGKVVDIFCDCVRAVNSPGYLYHMIPTLSSDRDFTTMGRDVGATPDGRPAGWPLSENQSPTQGKDTGGLTALLNSLARVPFRRIAGGPLNIKVHPGAVAGAGGLRNFYALLKTYFENGGMQTQVNILDRDQLVEARENPEKHRGLCIRVTGYSAFFTQMGRKAQDELIARTEQL